MSSDNSFVGRLEAAKGITKCKTDRGALSAYDNYLVFLSQPNQIFHIPPTIAFDWSNARWVEHNWAHYARKGEGLPRWLFEILRQKYPAYKKLINSENQKKNKKFKKSS